MAKINARELDPQRYSCIQTEQQELKKQYSSHITMARICPYCQNKLEILCKGNHGAVYVKCPHCGEQVFFPPVAFRLNRVLDVTACYTGLALDNYKLNIQVCTPEPLDA